MTVALAVGAVLAILCVVLVAVPFLREPGARDDRLVPPDELEQRRLELAEERDRALAALKELEFDHRTGKVSDDDYRELVGPLRRRAAEALRALDLRAAHAVDDRVPARPCALRARRAALLRPHAYDAGARPGGGCADARHSAVRHRPVALRPDPGGCEPPARARLLRGRQAEAGRGRCPLDG